MTDYRAFIENSSNVQHLLFQWQLVWAIPVFLLAAGVWLLRPWYCRRRHEISVRESMQRLGKAAVRDLSFDNGMDGVAVIDWLVLTPGEILVISLQWGNGIIFGAEKIDSWARVVGKHTYRFPNPLIATVERVLAVKSHAPQVSIRGIVLCEEGVSFPKGRPEGVMLPSEIPEHAKQWEGVDVPTAMQEAWNRLVELGTRGEQALGRDLLILRGEVNHRREIIAVSLFMLAAAISMWGGWQMLQQ